MPFDLGPATAAALALALFGAAFVRGYSGFGFSAIFIACASLVTNPVPLIAVVFLCEIAMTLVQAREIGGVIDWRRVGAMGAGAAVTIPVAVWWLTRIDENTARLAVAGIVLALSLILLAGWTLRARVGVAGHLGAGMASGLANGLAGVGGLPVVAFLTAQGVAPATFRGTMIAYLTLLDILTLPLFYAAGILTGETLYAAALALPILAVGVWLGGRRFLSASPTGFRRMAILLLLALALLGLARAAIFGDAA